MKKSLLLAFLALSLMAVLVSCNSDKDEKKEGSFAYTLLPDGTYEISAGENIDLEEVIIPSEHEGVPVTRIADGAFKEALTLNELTIPSSVTSIGKEAFYHCYGMYKLNLSEGLTEIGESAFAHCYGITSVVLPASLKTAHITAFDNCNNLYKVTNNSDLLISFSSDYFDPFMEIRGLNFSAKVIVKKDGKKRFRGEKNGKYIETEDNLLYFKTDENCYLIGYVGEEKRITLPLDFEGNPYKLRDFVGAKEIVLPDGMTEIDSGAFCNYSVESIEIPDGVVTIGNWAFDSCASLERVNIPDSVVTIGYRAFNSCASLERVDIPSSVTDIGLDAFLYCLELSAINVDSSNPNYKSIDGSLYTKDGKKLITYAIGKTDKTVELPSGVTTIGENAFLDGEKMEELILPEGVTHIGDSAFEMCKNLKKVTLPSSLVSIGEHAFYYCESLEIIELPEGLVEIGECAFGATKIPEISIPGSVKSLGPRALKGMKGLEKAVIQEGVETIGTEAFSFCYQLREVVIPSSVNLICKSAFEGCSNLTSVVVEDPSDWWYSSSYPSSNKNPLDPAVVGDPAQMAKTLSKKYTYYYGH